MNWSLLTPYMDPAKQTHSKNLAQTIEFSLTQSLTSGNC